MFRYVFELLSALFVFGLIRAIVSAVGRAVANSGSVPNPAYRGAQAAANPDAPEMREAGELRKDPVCGTFVAMNTPHSTIIDGKTSYFCSRECRDLYKSGRNTNSQWQKSTAGRS